MATRKLTDAKCRTAKRGTYADGNGLYLEVNKSGSRRWLFRWTDQRGKPAKMSIGRYDRGMTLVLAREHTEKLQIVFGAGGDPRTAKENVTQQKSFGEVAKSYIASIEPSFRNKKHFNQWRMTLLGPANVTAARAPDYCAFLRDIPVANVSTADVLAVLQPIWLAKPETAGRIRERVERVLDAATAAGDREGANPARWKGHLDKLLSKPKKLSRGHHKAMAYKEIPKFIKQLARRKGIAARSLEFTILTAVRSGEVRGMTWDEVDGDLMTWVIPAERMKASKQHRIPLCCRARNILDEMHDFSGGEGIVFPGAKKGKPMSDMTLAAVLKRMDRKCTVHGFRSSFRDWAAERTGAAWEVIEGCLAHSIGDATVRAYLRTDLLDKRRQLMEEWETFCNSYQDKPL